MLKYSILHSAYLIKQTQKYLHPKGENKIQEKKTIFSYIADYSVKIGFLFLFY